MVLSRRQFAKDLGLFAASAAFNRHGVSSKNNLRLGLNTYSLRALTADEALPVIQQVMHETNLQDCQLWFRHVEPAQFSPALPAAGQGGVPAIITEKEQEQRRALDSKLSEWRLTVPLAFFENIRARFHQKGLKIKSYSLRLGSSDAEIDRQFLMAKALGAEALIARVPESLTAAAAAAAGRHGLLVGLQFSDPEVLQRQLRASPYFRADPDIGDLTKGRIEALPFVKEAYSTFLSVDLKDATWGGASVPFGDGDSQMGEVIEFLRGREVRMTAYIDCDYPGTGKSAGEVNKCAAYVRRLSA